MIKCGVLLQAILDAERRAAATAGVALRPRSLQMAVRPPAAQSVTPEPTLDNALPPTTASPPKEHTHTNVLYLTTKHGQQGVLQIHEAWI